MKIPQTTLSKFIIVGGLSTLINYGIFVLFFHFFSFNPSLATTLGYISGFAFGYWYNRKWTFETVLPKQKVELFLYASVYLFSLGLSVAILNILISVANIHPLLSNIVAIGISTTTNFLGLRFVVFNIRTVGLLDKLIPHFTLPFWIIFGIKIIAGGVFGSHFITQGFIPFVHFFSQTFQNPYAHFSNLDIAPFPYPFGMLVFVGLPFIVAQWIVPSIWMGKTAIQLLLMRIPLLIFDIIIYLVLCKMLPTKEKYVLWLYFASPILFYISYIHGQFDIIPTAFLILSLLFITQKRFLLSFVLLGLGIATKTHLLIVLPFYLIYLYRNNIKIRNLLRFSLIPPILFLLLNPYIFSSAFTKMVFNNPEQQRLFSLILSFNFNELSLFVAPAAIFFVLYKFSTYERLNSDSLILALGLTYTVLIALVPPMPGWYFWSFPFLIFFLIKFKKAPIASFVSINFFFLLYYVLGKDLQLFESFGQKSKMVESLTFTALEVSVIILTAWSYKMGIQTNELFQRMKDRFLLAVAGDSGVGKSTLSSILENTVGAHQVVLVNGDDIHKWERGDPHWNELTHLNPKSNKIHTDYEHISSLLRGETIERQAYDHSTGNFVGPVRLYPKRMVLLQGLMPFILDPMRQLTDLKIYIEADEDLRVKWKTERDNSSRGHDKNSIKTQIEKRKPDAEKFIHPQKNFADWVIHYSTADNRKDLQMQYLVKNSIGIDPLVYELETIDSLSVKHGYHDINFQNILISGTIASDKVSEIAYRLFPNLYDLLEHKPKFEENLAGIHQLFFINYLSHHYRHKHATLS